MNDQTDNLLTFSSYEEYIKTKITPTDLYYLEDEQLVFEIFSLGLKSKGVLSFEDFNSIYHKKKIKEEKERTSEEKEKENAIIYDMNSLGDNTKDFFYVINCHLHFCKEKKICTILFIRYVNKNKSEISSYIDINNDKVRQKINQKKYIYGSKKDLAYYNWHNNYSCTNNSENFEIVVNKRIGLIFKYTSSGKYFILNSTQKTKICLNDNVSECRSPLGMDLRENNKTITLCEQVERLEIRDKNYLQCVLYTLRL
ncbi:conserved protein, unknown function [Plasmodium gonderi]|uniref:Cilia- and flagella-associated protein 299 n=1 Tax=Plasmodium gonderi TaxID=77519 RepID=A0A1Y1JCY2_PLAGO|nr:conserved protein, unknown function [Plasmodium gonderi]GAW80381.1 conserved protein, unknown function [Plasmodium gonderi]